MSSLLCLWIFVLTALLTRVESFVCGSDYCYNPTPVCVSGIFYGYYCYGCSDSYSCPSGYTCSSDGGCYTPPPPPPPPTYSPTFAPPTSRPTPKPTAMPSPTPTLSPNSNSGSYSSLLRQYSFVSGSTFQYQEDTIPTSVSSVMVMVCGANGGSYQGLGGKGGLVKGVLSVTPGASFTVIVGESGDTGGVVGGGGKGYATSCAGGGFSYFYYRPTNAYLIAGGGGGAYGSNGGEGGGPSGGLAGHNTNPDNNGQPGTLYGGGAAGIIDVNTAGSSWYGGNAANGWGGGGGNFGGGGGYYAGGGGCGYIDASFTSATETQGGCDNGNGYVESMGSRRKLLWCLPLVRPKSPPHAPPSSSCLPQFQR